MGKIDPRYTDWRRVCFARHHRSCLCRLLARARALFFNFFFPQWEHFYGNWSPCNGSSWYACSTPDSPMTSRTPSANQQPATSPTNTSPLRSPAVDAAASCHRWRQKVTNEARVSHQEEACSGFRRALSRCSQHPPTGLLGNESLGHC